MNWFGSALGFLISLLIGGAAARIGLAVTRRGERSNAYRRLRKPKVPLPPRLVGLFWCLLYPLMALGAWLVWRQGGFSVHPYALTLYLIQLGLSLVWLALFASGQSPPAALVVSLLLWAVMGLTVAAFLIINHLAGQLLFTCWAFSALTIAHSWDIWRQNA